MIGKIVKCIYNFAAETETDLEIKIGDIIRVTKVINSDWCEGQLHDNKGQFPSAYVEECDDVFDLAIAIRSFSGDQDGDLSFNNGDYIVVTEIVDENWMQGYIQGGSHGLFPRAFVKQISLSETGLSEGTPSSETVTTSSDPSLSADETPSGDPSLSADETPSGDPSLSTDETLSGDPSLSTDETPSGETVTSEVDEEPESTWVDVLENFSAMDSTELDLFVGTKIKVLCDVDDFWCKGVSETGKEGIFPRNFVDLPEIVEDKQADVTENNEVDKIQSDIGVEVETVPETNIQECENKEEGEKEKPKVIGRTVALFDFLTEEKGDLSFNCGDEVLLLEKVNDNWMKGQIEDRIGIFPSNYVEVKEMYPVEETNTVPSDSSDKNLIQDENDDDDYINVETLDNETKLAASDIKSVDNDTTSITNEPEEIHKDNTNKKSSDTSYENVSISPRVSPQTQPTPTKPPTRPGKPQRPKLPESKKPIDEVVTPFSYQFKTKSQPLVIIPTKYFKQGSCSIVMLKNWKNEKFVKQSVNGANIGLS